MKWKQLRSKVCDQPSVGFGLVGGTAYIGCPAVELLCIVAETMPMQENDRKTRNKRHTTGHSSGETSLRKSAAEKILLWKVKHREVQQV